MEARRMVDDRLLGGDKDKSLLLLRCGLVTGDRINFWRTRVGDTLEDLVLLSDLGTTGDSDGLCDVGETVDLRRDSTVGEAGESGAFRVDNEHLWDVGVALREAEERVDSLVAAEVKEDLLGGTGDRGPLLDAGERDELLLTQEREDLRGAGDRDEVSGDLREAGERDVSLVEVREDLRTGRGSFWWTWVREDLRIGRGSLLT